MPIPLNIQFEGEYSFDNENWYALSENDEVPMKDPIIIRCHFLTDISEGTILDLYCNHIGASISVNNQMIYMDTSFVVRYIGIYNAIHVWKTM